MAAGLRSRSRARDTNLNRNVALKVLPDAFTADPDRLARFKREAHVLASLNHPNTAAIYGLEESEGVRALVLELVDGPTLAYRIAQEPISIDEALPIATQTAEALEAAHEQGIVHRGDIVLHCKDSRPRQRRFHRNRPTLLARCRRGPPSGEAIFQFQPRGGVVRPSFGKHAVFATAISRLPGSSTLESRACPTHVRVGAVPTDLVTDEGRDWPVSVLKPARLYYHGVSALIRCGGRWRAPLNTSGYWTVIVPTIDG